MAGVTAPGRALVGMDIQSPAWGACSYPRQSKSIAKEIKTELHAEQAGRYADHPEVMAP
ncbi:MAG: hypothetical protein H7232_00395 [Aeromicrobium sp.]|nr:hypothetical protein [Burkholderiales bacterium]